MYDGLLRWLDNPPKLQPWLAESYEITNDGEVVAVLGPPVATTLRIRPATRHGGWTEITPIKADESAAELLDELREPRV